MSGLKEPQQGTGGIRLDEGALGGGGLRADTPLTSGNAAAASVPMAFGFSAAELQDAEVMMRRKLWRDTAAKLGFAERQVELMAETIDPVAVHTAVREFVSRKKVLEGKGANFAHLKQLRAYPEFNKWYEQLATFERMEPGAARAALAGYLQAEIRQWLATRARELYDNDGQVDAGEWALLVRDAELFWIAEGVATTEAQAACRVAAGDPLWAPPPPDESAELRARELRQELEGQQSVLREEAQRNAQASAALEEQTLALQAMERKAAEMMAQATRATEAAERRATERKAPTAVPPLTVTPVDNIKQLLASSEAAFVCIESGGNFSGSTHLHAYPPELANNLGGKSEAAQRWLNVYGAAEELRALEKVLSTCGPDAARGQRRIWTALEMVTVLASETATLAAKQVVVASVTRRWWLYTGLSFTGTVGLFLFFVPKGLGDEGVFAISFIGFIVAGLILLIGGGLLSARFTYPAMWNAIKYDAGLSIGAAQQSGHRLRALFFFGPLLFGLLVFLKGTADHDEKLRNQSARIQGQLGTRK